jgi:hypothetical protein
LINVQHTVTAVKTGEMRQQEPAATAAASATTSYYDSCNLFDHNTGLVNPGGDTPLPESAN